MHLMEIVFKLAFFFVPDANVPRAIRKKRKANAPKPLPLGRKRALSISSDIDKVSFVEIQLEEQKGSTRKQYMCSQQQSNFLTLLPLEIRRKIWSFCVGNMDLHLVREAKKLVAIQCLGEEEESRWPPCAHLCWGQPSRAFPGYHGICPGYLLDTNGCPLFPDPIPLLQTCRMIYSEAIPMLYHENTFRFNHIDTILSLSQTILPSRLNLIRTVHLAYAFPVLMYGEDKSENAVPPYDAATWEETCRILANMAGLRELYMHLGGSLLYHEIHEVLGPLHHIQQTDVFELFVGIRQDPTKVYQMDNKPFKFVSLNVDTGRGWFCCR
ncbi:hypothetical protein P170DRAFT_508954 [Aspergillus steynii IBT 23096]|uniref:DUF7730 domain-containing protein n=1 Tax=Aspergillus steynii IBT 23096 TaxID=1392250 RepID=A0A2I2GD83_9EURO|nr:uncharacterized protein P170DRAFT_508954 [Aspergillus steynii IBT 23096]PLB50858.1 hypothetical protein P170DRAFT_508954 [Aspergillus steynii IBT 23096]